MTDKNSDDRDNPLAPASEATSTQSQKGRRTMVVALVAMVAILAVTLAAWMLWPSNAGKPVPAPRTVSFGQSSSSPEPVAAGEQLLTLSPAQLTGGGLKIEVVGESPSAEATGLLATGVVQANSYKETPVVSLVGGIVRRVGPELGQGVRRGQTVAVVFSNELAETESRYLATVVALDEHHRHHLRTVKLVAIGAASQQDLETATTQYRETQTNLENLRQKLLLLGLSSQRIAALNSSSQISSEVSVPAPSSGTLTSRSVNPGEVIEANKELMRVTDLSSVWVVGQVYEKDLATIRVGSGANVSSDAYPGRVFRGRVSYVDPKVDAATRTAQLRIELANPGQLFKIGMYVNVAFGAVGAAEKTIAAVPKNAVQIIGNRQYVFLATENPSAFVLRPVRLGPESSGLFPVLEGLHPGDRVVTEGSFLLRAEWLKTHPN